MKEKFYSMKKLIKKCFIKTFCAFLSLMCLSTSTNISGIISVANSQKTSTNSFIQNIRVVDEDTMDSYVNQLLSDKNGSRYAGRIWSDKSVFSGDINLDMETDGYNGTIKNNSNFLHAFSALGSSQEYSGQIPTSLAIVIDNSGSMYTNSNEWDKTRIHLTVESVNKTIDSFMEANPLNEVAVVLFGEGNTYGNDDNPETVIGTNTAQTIIPMGHYTYIEGDEYAEYLKAGWVKPPEATEGIKGAEGTTEGIEEAKKIEATGENPNHEIKQDGGYVYVNKKIIFNEDGYKAYENGYTSIQAGIYQGMKELLAVENKTNTLEGITFNRIPALIVLTDGAATSMLQGVWSNPTDENNNLKSKGFTNDFGDKRTSLIKEWENSENRYTFSWNMFMQVIDDRLQQIGYGDGTLSPGHNSIGEETENSNPGEKGTENLKEFAGKVRSSQGTMLLSTLMTAGYMKAAVEKAYKQQCQIYTISVDMVDPSTIIVPEKIENDDSYEISTSQVLTNPKYFTKEYLKEKGYIKDIDNITEETTAYDAYTAGSEIILGIVDAIDGWDEWKNHKSETPALDRLKSYAVYIENKGLFDEMETGTVTLSRSEYRAEETTYQAIKPIGPDHMNAYLVDTICEDISYPHLTKNDKNNPYNLSDEDIDIDYVTTSYYARTTVDALDELEDVFNRIMHIINNRPFSPIGGDNYGITNYLNYVDPIGECMEVKNNLITVGESNYDMALLLFGKLYGLKEDYEEGTSRYYHIVEDENSTDEYKWNTCYGDSPGNSQEQLKELYNQSYPGVYKLSDITVWIERTSDNSDTKDAGSNYKETLHFKLSTNVMPLQIANIVLDINGVKEYKTNLEQKEQSTPIRLFYAVDIADNIKTNENIDVNKIDKNYILNHQKNVDGKKYLYLYSNYYDGGKYNNSNETEGNATATFIPSNQNRFYIFQKNLTIYKNSSAGEGILKEYGGETELSNPVTNLRDIKADETYYMIIDYYLPTKETKSGGKLVQYAIARLGSEFYGNNGESHLTYYDVDNDKEVESAGKNIVVATKIGKERVGDLKKLSDKKDKNYTETADYYYASNYESISGETNCNIINHLGNNGLIKIPLASLFLAKSVIKNIDKYDLSQVSDESFEFTISINDDVENIETYLYKWDGEKWRITGTKILKFAQDKDNSNIRSAKVTLKDNEGILLYKLNNDMNYTIIENIKQSQQNKGFNFMQINHIGNENSIISNNQISGLVKEGTMDSILYINSYNHHFDNLSIKKTVKGNAGELNRNWNFDIVLYLEDKISLLDKYSYKGSSFIKGVNAPNDGEITFTKTEDGYYKGSITLKHGQEITIQNLPRGTKYEVKERESNTDKYKTDSINSVGVLRESETVEFTNTKNISAPIPSNKLPSTGVNYVIFVVATLSIGMAIISFIKYKSD